MSDVTVLLYEARVLKTDFGQMLATLEPQVLTAAPGDLQSVRFPFLRRLVHLDPATTDTASAPPGNTCSEHRDDFLERGTSVSTAGIDARTAR